MDFELGTCTADNLREFLETTEATFGHSAPADLVDRFEHLIPPDRATYVSEGDVMVGTAGIYPFTLTIPGGEIPAAGVTMVGVLPSHRRKGVLTRMMRRQFEESRDRGEPVAVLWASEGGIYERFGYGIAAVQHQVGIERQHAKFRDDPGPSGRIRLHSLDKAAHAIGPIWDRVRKERPGLFVRTSDWWKHHTLADPEEHRRGGGPMFCAVWEKDSEDHAYALYRLHASWDWGSPNGRLNVKEVVADSSEATREMWRFLFGVDLAIKVETNIASLAVDDPLPLMIEEMRRVHTIRWDSLWVRIVDVAPALEARSYATGGVLVLELDDPHCPWNTGRWRIEARPDGASVATTGDEPDVRMTPQDLGQIYLGGFTFSQLHRAGRLEELSTGAIARADSMFVTDVAPWCPEIF